MSHDPAQLQKLNQARVVLAQRRADTARRLAELAASRSALEQLRRSRTEDDPTVGAARQALDKKLHLLKTARQAEREARATVGEALRAWLGADIADDVGTLSAAFPITLFPVRLETRFKPVGGPRELWVRIYPDEILADTHEPWLTEAEWAAGRAYWEACWESGQGEHQGAWQRLLGQAASTRAAWIVRETRPTNWEQRGQARVRPVFPTPAAVQPQSWTRAAEAPVLPDRWLVLAYRRGAGGSLQIVHRVLSEPVVAPLALTVNPALGFEDGAGNPFDSLLGDPDVSWTFDFERAVEVGMGVIIPNLSPDDLTHGFDRLLVVGIKGSLSAEDGGLQVESLLEAHRHTRGLAFVPQGTPTNNTSSRPAGFPPEDPTGAKSFSLERTPPPLDAVADGRLFMSAPGLPPATAAHLAGADGGEQRAARAMNRALWPATLGYFLSQLATSGGRPRPGEDKPPDHRFSKAFLEAAEQHFIGYVRGRGPYPAFRVGDTPYGLLPVTSLDLWESADQEEERWVRALKNLRDRWQEQVPNAPRLGRSDDPDGDLLGVLGMDASAREVRVRAALGGDLLLNLYHYRGTDFFGVDWASLSVEQQRRTDEVLRALGDLAWDELQNRAIWHPRVCEMAFQERAYPFRHPFVTAAPLSEQERLPSIRGGENYIDWIRRVPPDGEALGSKENLRKGLADPEFQEAPPLLYLVLRHGMLLTYADVAFDILVAASGGSDPNPLRPRVKLYHAREAELVGLTTDAQLSIWDHLSTNLSQIPALREAGSGTLGDYLWSSPDRAGTDALQQYRDSLAVLMELPTAELERLFTETLDVCAHRLDAWVTSLASRRLQDMRQTNATGTHLGAFGWVEDLKPAQGRYTMETLGGRTVFVQRDSGGYVQAPSMTHAAAAAVLRNAHVTRTGEAREQFALNLSSKRVRTGRRLLDAVREGQPLGAVLGYLFERGLQERTLGKFIAPLRDRFPLAPVQHPPPDVPQETLAARNVVDGLALQRAEAPFDKLMDPFSRSPVSVTEAEKVALEAERDALTEALDAVADLLTAESVYQMVRGNTAASAATLDAMAKGVRPPDPEVARAPRGGTALTHRVAVVLGDPAAALPEGWPPPTPRARAEPRLDAWVGSLLGDPRKVRCRVSYSAPTSDDPQRQVDLQDVTLADLGLRPLDVLALAEGERAFAQASELDMRVAYVALERVPEDGPEELTRQAVRIRYARRLGSRVDDLRNDLRTFPEVLELARAINAVVGGARPLRPEDLLPPEAAGVAQAAVWEAADANGRAKDAFTALEEAEKGLGEALSPPDGTPDPTKLRDKLLAVALLGIPGTIPESAKGSSSAQLAALLEQARAAHAVLKKRLDVATPLKKQLEAAETTPSVEAPESAVRLQVAADLARASLGPGFVFLTLFQPAEATPGELARALVAGPSLVDPDAAKRAVAVRKWLQGAARVHPPLERWRRLTLYLGALGGDTSPPDIAQLPHHEGDRWVALAFENEAQRPAAGRVSLALHRAAKPVATEPWTGLLLDEWNELIPNKTELTGVAFHYDDPGAEAPQAVLLAVPPRGAAHWDLESLTATLNGTLDLAKIRAVDGELLEPLSQVLPATLLAANTQNETVSTDFLVFRREDESLIP